MNSRWLKVRQDYIQSLKSQIAILTGDTEDTEISDYRSNLENLYQGSWEQTKGPQVFGELCDGEVVLCGDFHSFPPCRSYFYTLCKRLKEEGDREVSVGLECINSCNQQHLDGFYNGDISADEFQIRVGWDENWGFPFYSYGKLIKKLRDLKIKVYAVNSDSENLKKRDVHIAERITALRRDKELFLLLIGQLHLAPDYLPQELKSRGSNKVFSIHLDVEPLFFKTAEAVLDGSVNYLRSKEHFCYFNSPPWVQWQSHLLYLEELNEEEGYKEEGESVGETFAQFVRIICKDLKLELESSKDISIYMIDDLLSVQEDDLWSKRFEALLSSETTVYLPEMKEGFLTVKSLNHIAALAGRYVHAHLMGLESLPWENQNLALWGWLEACSYFMSKLINPKRKPYSSKMASAFLKSRMEENNAALLLGGMIKQRASEISGKSFQSSLAWPELINASRLSGALLGETLFQSFVQGRVSEADLKSYFSRPILPEEDFERFYNFLILRLES